MLYRIRIHLICLTCIFALSMPASVVRGGQSRWQLDPNVAGSWHNLLHWSAGIPGATTDAVVANGGWAEIVADADWLSLMVGATSQGGVNQQAGLSQGGSLVLGDATGQQGRYVLNAGAELETDTLTLGRWGQGRFTHSAGDYGVNWVDLGLEDTGQGTYELIDGHLSLFVGIRVGVNGVGALQLGDATHEPALTGPAVPMTVRASAFGSGEVFGWGLVNVTGPLTNNGRVIADGFGSNRTLDMSRFDAIYQQESYGLTQPDGTQAGWYARNGGALLLPTVTVQAGDGAYNWGEQASDTTLDLVNSVRLDVTGATPAGDFTIQLLAEGRADVPPIPAGYHRIGVWQIDFDPTMSFSSADVLARYDDQAAADLGIQEEHLYVWRWDGQRWRLKHATIDPANNRISAEGLADTNLLAIGGVAGIPADANGDGVVDDADYTVWADNYGRNDGDLYTGDYNADGIVDDADYTWWSDHYAQSVNALTPEPAAVTLLMTGLLLLTTRRRVT